MVSFFISLHPVPGIKVCDDIKWHTSSYLTVLLCTHPQMLPWRPCGSAGGMPVCIQMLRVAWRSPSIRRVNWELRQRLPLSLRRSLLSLQSSKRGAAELPKHTGSREPGFGCCCLHAAHTWLCKSARPLNPHGGIDLLSLFAALCPAYWGGARGPPWHSVWFSEGDSSKRMWTQ